MKVAAKWVAQRAPAFLTGAVAGGLLRAGGNLLVTNFVVAGLVATSPALASVAALASAAAVGVVAGGVANIVKTSIWGTAEEKQGNWKRAAFKKGWKWGALGGLAGFIAVDHFQGGAVLKNLYSPLKDLFSSGTPLPPAILPVAVPLLSHGAAQSAAQAAHVAHAAVFHPMPNTAPFGVDQILTPEEIVRHHISPELVKMMSSKDPETLMRACKEVSYHLINDAPTNPAKGVEFLQRGVHIFIESNPHTRGMVNLAHQMYADLAFEKYKVFLKTGDANARDTSLALAKLAHHAVHDYQGRLVEELHKAVTPKPATVVKLSLVPKSAMVQKPSMATNLSWMSKPPLALAA
jgi:hypothetical protein